MRQERLLRFEVGSHEQLGRIAAASLPLELKEVSADVDFFRVVYFDTSAGDLERKGASVRLCIRPDETQVLQVDISTTDGGAADVTRRHAEAEVPARPATELFHGDYEPARMVRALVDPSHLRVAFELETMRRVRRGAPAERADDIVVFAFDAVTVRKGEISGELYELEVTVGAKNEFSGLVEDIERAYAARLILAETVARARRLLDHLLLERLEQQVRGARQVAVIAYDEGHIALCQDGDGLRVPTGPGSGQDACRRVLRSVFGRAHARIRLLGTSAGVATRPALEVWLAEGAGPQSAGACTWLPLEIVLERVGSPQLRDASTLAALHTVARSGLAVSPTTNGNRRDVERPAYPVFEHAVAAAKMTAAKMTAVLDAGVPVDVPPQLLLNPELSRLAFDERILIFAQDARTPLLERARFLSMFGQRLDDFFMTRVSEFKKEVAQGSTEPTIDGLSPEAQLDVVRVRARQITNRAYAFLRESLLPQLAEHGIRVLRWSDLDDDAREHLQRNTARDVEDVITPVIADPTHPFPHMRNLRPAVAALLRLPESRDDHFVAIELPSGSPRFVPLPGGRDFVPLEEVILASLPNLYPGLQLVEAGTFRVTRNAVIELSEDPAGGVLAAIEEEVARRPFGEVVRLEVQSSMSAQLRERLLRELQFELPELTTALSEDDVYAVEGLVDLAALRELGSLELPALRFEPIQHGNPLRTDSSIFEQLQQGDVFIRFPDDAFDDTVERFFEEAAEDPDVLAMKITLYRTNPESRLVQALARARSAGKDAFALIELKASFDERRNTEWARSLQAAGIHVVFSPSKIKVHAKLALVIRRETDGLRRYVYIGTGNLNAATARGYTDVGILTTNPDLTQEVNGVFNLLTGYSNSSEFQHLLVSPFTMRARFIELIDREIEHARAGRGGRIRIQLNGLADKRMISALYRASHAGVVIDLAIREICCLRPGIEGLSTNIHVTSLLGRFLQHARIFCFHNAGEPEYFIGSADWRPRNLSKRVEVVTPVLDPRHCAELDHMLEYVLHHPDSWELCPDGSYVRGEEVIRNA
ncbi:MAG TPA: polyphosphate kinase 1 [Longimicrobiales bacterium]|nr:polyphosphate kinase 1 [Longimicrobiales bacterium]